MGCFNAFQHFFTCLNAYVFYCLYCLLFIFYIFNFGFFIFLLIIALGLTGSPVCISNVTVMVLKRPIKIKLIKPISINIYVFTLPCQNCLLVLTFTSTKNLHHLGLNLDCRLHWNKLLKRNVSLWMTKWSCFYLLSDASYYLVFQNYRRIIVLFRITWT